MLQRLKSWCLNSLTIAWGYIKISVGGLLYVLGLTGDTVKDPDVKEVLGHFQLPTYVTLGLMILGAVTIAARLRGKVQDAN